MFTLVKNWNRESTYMALFRKKDRNLDILEKAIVKTGAETSAAIKTASQKSSLERFNAVAGIAGFIASVIFAVYGIILTKKYGDNKDQIQTLTQIAYKQDTQNLRITKMVSELAKQNQLQQDLNNEMKLQTGYLSNQSKLLFNQLQISEGAQREHNTQTNFSFKSNYLRLAKLHSELLPFFSEVNRLNDETTQDEARDLYNRIYESLITRLDNPLINDNDSIYNHFLTLANESYYASRRQSIEWLPASDSNYKRIDVFDENGNVMIVLSDAEKVSKGYYRCMRDLKILINKYQKQLNLKLVSD